MGGDSILQALDSSCRGLAEGSSFYASGMYAPDPLHTLIILHYIAMCVIAPKIIFLETKTRLKSFEKRVDFAKAVRASHFTPVLRQI